jgi:AraC-like DNA-binding protein
VPLIETLLKIISLLVYIIPVYLQLLKHRKNVKNVFSNANQKYLDWLFLLSNGILLLWTVLLITTLFNIAGTMGHLSYDGRVLKLSTDGFLIFICYFGLRQPALYNSNSLMTRHVEDASVPDVLDEEPVGDEQKSVAKYKKSGLASIQADEIHKNLLILMETTKPYLNDNLTLFGLAEMMQVSPTHLSQVINLHEEKNFFDFVNSYRVEEVKRIIRINQLNHFTLLGIALECGFNSKAAFNRAFKKFTGLTPSQFKTEVNRPNKDTSVT